MSLSFSLSFSFDIVSVSFFAVQILRRSTCGIPVLIENEQDGHRISSRRFLDTGLHFFDLNIILAELSEIERCHAERKYCDQQCDQKRDGDMTGFLFSHNDPPYEKSSQIMRWGKIETAPCIFRREVL